MQYLAAEYLAVARSCYADMEYRRAKQRRREQGQSVNDDCELSAAEDAPRTPQVAAAEAMTRIHKLQAEIHGVTLEGASKPAPTVDERMAKDFKKRIVMVDSELSNLHSERHSAHSMYLLNLQRVDVSLRNLMIASEILREAHSLTVMGTSPYTKKRELYKLMGFHLEAAMCYVDSLLVKDWSVTPGHSSLTILTSSDSLDYNEYEFHYTAVLKLVGEVRTEVGNLRQRIEHRESEAVLRYDSIRDEMKTAIGAVRT